MTLPTTGAISIGALQNEFSGPFPSSLSQYYAGGGYVPTDITGTNGAVPSSGTISLSNFYGVTNIVAAGYVGGGLDSAGVNTTLINRFIFSTEAISTPSAVLAGGRRALTATNSVTRGYFMGGINSNGDHQTEIDGINFTTLAAINPAAALALARYGSAGVSSNTAGYVMGGQTSSATTTEIDAIVFATEAANNPSAVLSLARVYSTGINSSANGYACGGGNGLTGTVEIDGITFSNSTAINPAAALAVTRMGPIGTNSTTKGYIMGGDNNAYPSVPVDSIDSFVFSSSTVAAISAVLVAARQHGAGVNSVTKGYVLGGSGATTYSTEIDGILFSTEAAVNPAAVLSIGRYITGGCQSGSY